MGPHVYWYSTHTCGTLQTHFPHKSYWFSMVDTPSHSRDQNRSEEAHNISHESVVCWLVSIMYTHTHTYLMGIDIFCKWSRCTPLPSHHCDEYDFHNLTLEMWIRETTCTYIIIGEDHDQVNRTIHIYNKHKHGWFNGLRSLSIACSMLHNHMRLMFKCIDYNDYFANDT